ncbi:MAG: hypothetical protein ACO3IB_07215 [Phycisphaerales bacterium]
MGAVRPNPEPGTPFVPSRSRGRWEVALVACLIGALISGFLYAFCLMSAPIREMWTTPGRSVGPIAGLAGGVCSLVAIGFYVAAIVYCRVAAHWLARTLAFVVGAVVVLTCFAVLIGQAPVGAETLVVKGRVEFRPISLGAGALEVLMQPSLLGARLEGLRSIAASDKVLFANVFLGALVCAALVGDLSYRFARWWATHDLMLDERTGNWFGRPVEAGAFERWTHTTATYADIPLLVRLPEREAVADLVSGQTVLILWCYPSEPSLDRKLVLVSIDEVTIRPKRFLRRPYLVEREVLPPTFIGAELFDALMQGRS